jgi:outer membrane immunogenic protein
MMVLRFLHLLLLRDPGGQALLEKQVMKLIASFIGATASVLLVGAASAADLPTRKEPPPVVAPPAFTWTGWHAGIVGAYAGDSVKYNTSLYSLGARPIIGMPVEKSFGTSGFTVGYESGYSWQVDDHLVVGYESDFSYANVTTNSSGELYNSVNSRLNYLGTERVRAGYAIGRFLPYVTAGFAYGYFNSLNWTSAGELFIPIANNSSKWRGGWTIGGGLEYAVTDQISVKADYLYASMSAPNGSAIGIVGPSYLTVNSGQYNLNIARVGVNYHIRDLGSVLGLVAPIF